MRMRRVASGKEVGDHGALIPGKVSAKLDSRVGADIPATVARRFLGKGEHALVFARLLRYIEPDHGRTIVTRS